MTRDELATKIGAANVDKLEALNCEPTSSALNANDGGASFVEFSASITVALPCVDATWRLDTGQDGHDERGLTGSREEVLGDVEHKCLERGLDGIPAHWTLIPEELYQDWVATVIYHQPRESVDAVEDLSDLTWTPERYELV